MLWSTLDRKDKHAHTEPQNMRMVNHGWDKKATNRDGEVHAASEGKGGQTGEEADEPYA